MKKQFITLGIIALLSLSAFAQQSCGTVKDYDGNTYKTVQLGSQCWMAENLKTTHYSDGALINQQEPMFFSGLVTYWMYPDRNSSNKAKYGLLYNWVAVMHNALSSNGNPSGVQGICPKGWHVPSDAEWTQLIDYVKSQPQYHCGGDSQKIAKSLASTSGWSNSSTPCAIGNNPSTNNATGFSVMPAGYCWSDYFVFGDDAQFWSATEHDMDNAHCWYVGELSDSVSCRINYIACGSSVRCLRD